MRIISWHCENFKFKPKKKAMKNIKELSEEEKEEKEIPDSLVILTAVESYDEGQVDKIVEKLVEEIKNISGQVNSENVVVYPYAHLSEALSKPATAEEVLDKTQKALEKEGFNAWKAPFGYYKEFEVKMKGHPLSELSREIRLEDSKEDKEGSKEESEKTGEESEEDPKQILREISKSRLDTSKLKKNDHRIIGKEMDLFSFNDVAPGMPFFHHNGLIMINELLKYWREEHDKAGYQEISTPIVLDKKLWKLSGHWTKFKENMFTTDYEDRDFAIKPMNCPGGMLVYKNSPKSYKDLPLKVGEIGTVHRQELSGNLGGLFRVIKMTQDDAHLFCKEEQLEEEIGKVIDLVDRFYNKFNLEFDHVELSTRPEKRIGSEEIWDKAEEALKNVIKSRKISYQLNEGDGAFYGPKIDFHAKDSQGRTWQLSTIQLDFSTPERFELEYTDEKGNQARPIMVHRVVYGTIERFLGTLLETTNGRVPTWLAPVQARVINFTDRNKEYSEKIIEDLKAKIPNLRVDKDFSQRTVQAKVRDAEIMRVPYVIVIGDKEEESGDLAIRAKGNKKIEKYSQEEFSDMLKKEIENRE